MRSSIRHLARPLFGMLLAILFVAVAFPAAGQELVQAATIDGCDTVESQLRLANAVLARLRSARPDDPVRSLVFDRTLGGVAKVTPKEIKLQPAMIPIACAASSKDPASPLDVYKRQLDAQRCAHHTVRIRSRGAQWPLHR